MKKHWRTAATWGLGGGLAAGLLAWVAGRVLDEEARPALVGAAVGVFLGLAALLRARSGPHRGPVEVEHPGVEEPSSNVRRQT